jgi:hypothetical protein
MCIIYNTIGSLTVVKDHLRRHGIEEFRSISDLLNFQQAYFTEQLNINMRHSLLIEQERDSLKIDIAALGISIEESRQEITRTLQSALTKLIQKSDKLSTAHTSLLQQWVRYIQKSWINLKIRKHKLQFNKKIEIALKPSINTLKKQHDRHKFIINQFAAAVNQSSRQDLQTLKRKKNIIDEISTYIYGAIGEQKVANELATLPDNFVLINDFKCSFKPAIYNRKENDYIKSVQIDHLLISPAGIFLIETKNWSSDSLENNHLYSPVAQIRRASFALYKILNTNIAQIIGTHYWGARKVPIKNLIVFTNQIPSSSFQYVKILGLQGLCSYLTYFKPIFTDEEVQMITKYLLHLSKNK